MELYYQIRAYHNKGKSIRWIAHTLGMSRQTVWKYCEGDTHPDVRKEYHRETTVVTDEIREFTLACLREDDEAAFLSRHISPSGSMTGS